MEYGAPKTCPVCGGRLTVTQMHCESCNTTVSGAFRPCRFCRLDEKQTAFLTVFLKNRGSIKDVEKEMGISYPTVRGMLDSLLDALQLTETAAQDEPAVQAVSAERTAQEEGQTPSRREILTLVAEGRMRVEEAARRLSGL